jgi:hypothetical protein
MVEIAHRRHGGDSAQSQRWMEHRVSAGWSAGRTGFGSPPYRSSVPDPVLRCLRWKNERTDGAEAIFGNRYTTLTAKLIHPRAFLTAAAGARVGLAQGLWGRMPLEQLLPRCPLPRPRHPRPRLPSRAPPPCKHRTEFVHRTEFSNSIAGAVFVAGETNAEIAHLFSKRRWYMRAAKRNIRVLHYGRCKISPRAPLQHRPCARTPHSCSPCA